MTVHFVTFATGSFSARRWLLALSARLLGKAGRLHNWSPSRLRKSGISDTLPGDPNDSTGYGWYAWKPRIILEALLEAADGDLVVYQDVGRKKTLLISGPLAQLDVRMTEKRIPCIIGVQVPEWGQNRFWTKPSVFAKLGLMDEYYLESPQIQASWSAWVRCPQSVAFLSEWADLCSRRDLISDDPGPGDIPPPEGFQGHRWDQSILTVIGLRDSMPTLSSDDLAVDGSDSKCVSSYLHQKTTGLLSLALRFAASTYSLIEYIPRLIGRAAADCVSCLQQKKDLHE